MLHCVEDIYILRMLVITELWTVDHG